MVGGRGAGVNRPVDYASVGLPVKPFFYTLDQIATLLSVEEDRLKKAYIYFDGRSTGRRRPDLMISVNIAPDTEKPEWRVEQRELVRWMKAKGFKYHEYGTFSN